MKAECDGTKKTQCADCGHEYYMDTKNHLKDCHLCKYCNSSNNQIKVKECTAKEDTVCGCVSGFYCNDADCSHCRPVRHCPPGEGVKVQASRTTDTVCVPCEDGTYSNISDFHSPCKTHTRCEDIGRVLQIPGTAKTDAICGNFKTHCHWMLPAGLWAGLVLTALVLFGLIICWRIRRKTCRSVSPRRSVTLVEMGPAVPESPLKLPLPTTQVNGHWSDKCPVETCQLPLFKSDDTPISYCTQDSMESSHPITPLKASVSFTESIHVKGHSGHGNFLRTHSEPQEDEWCGT